MVTQQSDMTAEERITKTKIRIVNGNPFFAYLSLYLTFEEDVTGKRVGKDAGMCVNAKGQVFYRKEFVDSISDDELLGVVVHEILHLVFLHLTRAGRRNHLRWNISTDLQNNTMLLANGYVLPKGIRANARNEFIILGKVIKDVDKLASEEIYSLIPDIPNDKPPMIYVTFDKHDIGEGDGDEDVGLTESELQKLDIEWFNRVQTASVLAQQRGQLPVGLERYIDKLKEAEINWRVKLLRFVQQVVPHDQSWCLDGNTRILTPRGYTPIKKIRQGRNVIGVKNNKLVYSKVKSKFKMKVNQMYVLKTKSGKILKCSPNHRILTKKGYVKAKDLLKGDKIKILK